MPIIDPLHLAIALGPVATYLLVLGAINLSSRPLLTTAGRDAAALGVGLSGLVVVGPLELFLIEEAASLYGVWVWAIMVAAYALLITLIILLMRPRLVIYNIGLEQFRSLFENTVARLDPDARWAGDSLVMPQLGVHLHLDTSPLLKNVQLVASGPQQNLAGWRQLEIHLATLLSRTRTAPNPFGVALLSFGILTATLITFLLVRDPSGVTRALNEMLRR
jgi:hypothetical protein